MVAFASWRSLAALIVFFIFGGSSYSQVAEICNNCIDDDNDGFIDCYDPDCSGDTLCDAFFYGTPTPQCQYVPPVFQTLQIQEEWQSDATVDTRITPVVGDIDNDGVPEVVVTDATSGSNNLYIINGQTGATERTIPNVPVHVFHDAAAIADADGDSFGEIVVVTNGRQLRMYEHTGGLKWGSSQAVGYGASLGALGLGTSWAPSFADFNNDCIPEIYTGNQIWSSATGAKLAEAGSGANYGRHEASQATSNQAAFSAAADVLPDAFCPDCSGLEMIVGNQVYSVNLAAGTMTLRATANNPTFRDGYTSVADWDLDGQLDVLVNMRNGAGLAEVYVWNPRTGAQIGTTMLLNNSTSAQATSRNNQETGHLNIADYDDDGVPEIGVAGHDQYLVIDNRGINHNLVELWSRQTNDGSTRTSGSAFDFEGDGATEVVYQDEDSLFVFDGATGAVKASRRCLNATRYNYPAVADVNGNGQANIVCVCGDGQLSRGEVTMWTSTLNNWIQARQVMNQHNYSVVNINDDLSIMQQQNSAVVPGLNSYLSQTAILDASGNPSYEAIDVRVNIDSISFSACTPRVFFQVCNQGDLDLSDSLFLSFYQGNPLTGGTLLNTSVSVASISQGSCSNFSQALSYSTPYSVYIYANDRGSVPNSAPVITFNECDTLNNSANQLISDPTDPQIICPTNANLSTAPNQCSAIFNYTAPIGTDNCSGASTSRTAGLGPGATFPLGSTTESYTVTDASGNSANCSFSVTVSDNQDPQISCPANISRNITLGICGAAVIYSAPVGSDNCSGASTSQTAGLGSGSTFGVGINTETYRVDDASGNSDSCSFTITVTDNIDPVVSGCPPGINLTPNVLDCTPPVTWTAPSFNDECGLASVTSSHNPGDNFPIGSALVTYTATDNYGNTSNCQFNVVVNPPFIDSLITNLGPNPACIGDTVTLQGVSGYPNYLWNSGAPTQTIRVDTIGTYILEVSNPANTCSAFDTVMVPFINGPKPNPIIEPEFTLLCGPDDTLILDVRLGYFAYSWSNGARTKTTAISSPGLYHVTVTNGFGCTGRDTVNVVRVSIPNPPISQNGSLLSTLNVYNNYQWYYNGNALLGETSFQYGPATLLGSYRVEVDSGGCKGFSDPFLMVGASEAESQGRVQVYPNPSEGLIKIVAERNYTGKVEMVITDALGRVLRRKSENNWSGHSEMDFQQEAKGVYFLRIRAEGRSQVVKLVKD